MTVGNLGALAHQRCDFRTGEIVINAGLDGNPLPVGFCPICPDRCQNWARLARVDSGPKYQLNITRNSPSNARSDPPPIGAT
ncbi:hypothetical protein Pan44_38390 [Caulifigura coniformis]|uniref:Uncharacterized protein n=1 Tax=Caulifigura coniformis TaxID=2527983 RepID=A0A517SI41_9PLAN|nr:hypothetical protein Pan44_38390 [Caulifigura coniformis]